MAGVPDKRFDNAVLRLLRENNDLKDAAAEVTEAIVDQGLADGIAKDIPVIGTLLAVFRIAGTYSNYLLAKKIALFLNNLADIPRRQREEQISKLLADEKYRHRVSDNLMLVLDRLNDMAKPELLASAWRAFLENKIDREQLFRFTRAIEELHIDDIPVLRDLFQGQSSEDGLSHVNPEWKQKIILSPIENSPSGSAASTQRDWERLQHLASCGLMTMDTGRGGGIGGRHAGLRLNSTGIEFARHVLRLADQRIG